MPLSFSSASSIAHPRIVSSSVSPTTKKSSTNTKKWMPIPAAFLRSLFAIASVSAQNMNGDAT